MPTYTSEELIQLQADVRQRINNYIRMITPPGAQIIDTHYYTPYIEVLLVCDGKNGDMGYYCCKQVGHNGKCYSATKGVSFTREN